MGLVIAGDRSGVGKTTITLALLATMQRRGHRVQSFKVGPDYIDPMFHQFVTRLACRNLDPVLTSEAYVQACFAQHTQGVDYAIVEGVMGLFDGATAEYDFASTAHIARLLRLPILLVLDCSHLSRSIAAVVHGYRTFDPTLEFAGIVLNRVGSDRHLHLLQTALAPLNLPILGILHREDAIVIPDRHLGLIPTDELPELNALVDRLAELGEACFDWDSLLPLLRGDCTAETQRTQRGWEGGRVGGWERGREGEVIQNSKFKVQSFSPALRLAVARDRAFNFYYQDNLDLLERLGAELVFWSPMGDRQMPEGVQGLYFGGGFPEVFAAELAGNWTVRQGVRAAIAAGMPTYAECGGLMYLAQELIDFAGATWEMVGVLPTQAQMGKRLTLGYRQAIAQYNSPLISAGQTLWGHEFHRSSLTQLPDPPLYHLKGFDRTLSQPNEGWQLKNLHASYVHLHWGANPEMPARFLAACDRFAQRCDRSNASCDL